MPERGPPLDLLLEHRDWVRRLALRLVRDAAEADDVEQQVWLAALEGAGAAVRSPRAWLGTVTRRAVLRRRRATSRRVAREERAARPIATDSTPAEVVARAEHHRTVVDAVLRLSPRLREAVLLHYFEGLPIREAAARLDAPVETVRSRLRLARGRLRERLAPDPTAARASGVLLLAGSASDGVVAPLTSSSLALPGVLAMTVAQKLIVASAVGLAALAGVLWYVELDRSEQPAGELDGARSEIASLEQVAADRAAAGTESSRRPRGERRATTDAELSRLRQELEQAKAAAAQARLDQAALRERLAALDVRPSESTADTADDDTGPSAADRERVLAALREEPDGSEHRWAVGQLIDWITEGGDEAEWAARVLDSTARDANLGPKEAESLENAFRRADAGSEARALFAAAAAAGWAHDKRLAGFLRGLPTGSEPQVHQQILRTLDRHPSEAFSDYVGRLLESETDPGVLRSAFDEDRAVAAARIASRAPRIVAAYARRLRDPELPDWHRRKGYFSLAMAGLHEPGRAAAELRSLAADADGEWPDRLRSAADLLDAGNASEAELQRLLD